MSATASHSDEISAQEFGGGDSEPIIDDGADLRPSLAAAAAGRPFRLYPEWAQRGPFW